MALPLRLSIALLLFVAAQGCQFYPPGEYLRFVRVSESLPVGGEVLQVEVHPRRNLTIQPVDKVDDIAFFKYRALNRTVVSIKLAKSLEDLVDRPSPQNVLKFRLVCDYIDGDDTITSYLSVTVYVEDVNDHHPVFIDAPYHVIVDELTPIGLTVFRGIYAVDKDKPNTPNSEVHYAIIAGNEKGKFGVEGSPRASLVLRNPVDYDMGDTNFLLTLLASDRGSPPRNSTTTLKVTVTDSDDLSPRFTHDVYRTQITEFYPITGKRIHQELKFIPPIAAYDQDQAINASVRYDLIAGNERHLFSLDPKNGTIFLERELDLDNLPGNTFTLQIQASQVDNALKAGVAQVEIELLDINDNQPQFEVDLYNISIVENLPNGFSVLQVVATDQDQGDNGEFVYHLVDPSQSFSIDSRSGWLTVRNQAKLDREQRPSLTMRVLAREKMPSVVTPPSDSFVNVEVTLLDANDNNPMFVPSNIYEFIVPMDTPESTEIGKVEAIDPDLGRNGMVLYELQRSNMSGSLSQLFSVNPQTGQITIIQSPLPLGRHALFVEASDQPVNPSERRFSLAVVTVEVNAMSKSGALPDFVGAPYEFWVGSDVSVGTSVGQIRVTEVSDSTKLIYDLLHSYPEGVPFAVEERSGTITVIDSMTKYERIIYDFEAVVTDEKSITLVTNVTIHVVHSDTMFAATSNDPIQLQFRVRENLSGALVGQLSDGNRTAGPWKPIRFVITNQPDVTEQFAVSQDGTIYTQRALDREYRESYQLTILAEGVRGHMRSGILYQVQVVIEDENDNAPVFDRSWYSGHVREDCLPNDPVALDYKIRARDADSGNNAEFSLSLHSEDAELFSLDPDTGSILVKGSLDREVRDTHKLWIVASDKSNLSSEVRLTIYVDDINDNAPQFVQMSLHSLPDIQLNRRSSSGVLVVIGNKTVPDIISSKEDDPQLLPVIIVPESLIVGTEILQLLAIDKDKGENATVTYRLFSEIFTSESTFGNVNNKPYTTHHFSVHPHSGSISVATLLPPESDFKLNISAEDGGGLQGYITVRIHVNDINNNAPTFDKYRYEFEIIEGVYSDYSIGQIIATDADFGENANISYKLLQKIKDSSDFPFTILSDGTLKLVSDLDREQQEFYTFRVKAYDNGPVGNQLWSTADVEVKVLDANDNAPEFHGFDKVIQTMPSKFDKGSPDLTDKFGSSLVIPVYLASVVENSPPGIPVIKIFANDSDSLTNGNGMFLFHIRRKKNKPQFFTIDSKEGLVTTTATLDFEQDQQHNITIIASDLGHPSLSSTAVLTVNVIDVPEIAEELSGPIFTHRYYELEVDENSDVPLLLLTLNVSEQYLPHSMKFSIVSSEYSSLFNVEPNNGSVFLIESPDREKNDRLEVTIRAQPAKRSRTFPTMLYPVHLTDLAPNEIKLVVRVRDVNDNPPVFALNGRPLVAAIPTTANYGYPIARLQAKDPDLGLNGEIRYQMLGGEAGYFTVDPISGQVRAAASFTHHAGRVFGFDVKATDLGGAHDGHSAIANVFVYILDDHKRLVMVMNAKPVDVERHVDNITWALSNVTGLDVRLRKLEPHPDDQDFNDATDLYLYAVDPMMNIIIDTEEFNEVLNAKQSEIRQVLEPYRVLETMTEMDTPTVKTQRNNLPLLTGLEVITIALGCIVFLGAFTAAICVACLHKNKKKLDAPYPPTTIDLGLRPKMHMDCKPRSLFHPNAFLEDSTEYGSNRSECTRHHHGGHHRHAPTCMRHHSRRRPTRTPSGILEVSLASLHSSARDSGICEPHRPPRGRCPCGHSSTHSSANSSNGSYEDSLKSLHRHHSNSSGGSAGGGGGGCSHETNRATNTQTFTPILVRRPSERLLVSR
ncbi:cadherin 89D [Lycorma delicatula]|uniref:cadherin 89D n=1 Tax=Lycorma delicatula TaxID=130591 RepID=UPI003F5132CC